MSEFIPLSVPNFGAREAELAGQAITSGGCPPAAARSRSSRKRWPLTWHAPRRGLQRRYQRAASGPLWPPASPAGNEVIVPTLTFIAAVNPLTRYVGAEPIFIGCDDSLCIDPEAVEDFCVNRCELRDGRLYNKATGAHIKALEVVHVFGNMATCPA